MKKLIVMMVAAAAMISAKAADSFIYWMIEPTAPAFSYASLYVDKGGGDIVALDEFLTGVAADQTQTSLAAHTIKVDASNLGSSYSYYVELMNAEGEATHKSGLFGYTDIASYIYQAPNPTPKTAFDMGKDGFTAVPEPTSGLLLLLGVAGLALKRKRA